MKLDRLVAVAAGREKADLVLRGGRVVNVCTHEIQNADVAIAEQHVAAVGGPFDGVEVVNCTGLTLCPGFVDAHVHIESSMLSVAEFSRTVVTHGTVAVIADPHELANVMGAEGIRYVLRSSKYAPIQVYVMLSSCVPASQWESSGAELGAVDLLPFLADPWVLGLAEIMDYPGVIGGRPDVLDKLRVAENRLIDGHAPGLVGTDLQAYAASGVQSDHECTSADEALAKLRAGMHIMIREGTAARNLDALIGLVTPANAAQFMFCTDDKHVDDLLSEGQIDCMVRRAVELGLDPILALRLATLSPARYCNLRRLGAIAPGYRASIVALDNLTDCRVRKVWSSGRLAAEDGACVAERVELPGRPLLRGSINTHWLDAEDFVIPAPSSADVHINVIELIENQLATRKLVMPPTVRDGRLVADPQRDLAKLAVVERHAASGRVGLGFVKGLGLRRGAVASTVAHDAHNLIVAGTDDSDILAAAIHLVKIRGGLCVVADGEVLAELPLPIGGLMSDQPARDVADGLARVRAAARELGCGLRRPFMAISFLSLSVIGAIKLTDHGLIDVDRFTPINLVAE